MTNCPFCDKPVSPDQVICLNCGRQIKPLEPHRSSRSWVIYPIIAIVVLSVAMTLILFLPSFFGA